jgi:hypothetical protein
LLVYFIFQGDPVMVGLSLLYFPFWGGTEIYDLLFYTSDPFPSFRSKFYGERMLQNGVMPHIFTQTLMDFLLV